MEYLLKKGADINIKDNEGVGVWDCITDGRLVLTSFSYTRQKVLYSLCCLKVEFVRVELLSFSIKIHLALKMISYKNLGIISDPP